MSIEKEIIDSLKEAVRIIIVDGYILWQPSKGDAKTPLGPWYALHEDTGAFIFNTTLENYSYITDVDVSREDKMEYWGFDFDYILSDVLPRVKAAFSKEAFGS